MKKSACFCVIATGLALALCSCGSAASFKDGTYTGESTVWEDEDEGNGNGYGVATLTITDGKISACTFETYEPDGTKKEGAEYGMVNGKIGNQDYYNKAQRALAANEVYSQQLVDTGSLDSVDLVSGATISHGEFQEAVNAALDQAQK